MTWVNIKTAEDKQAEALERERQAWKASRQAAMDAATVTTSTGKVFDADEKSISRMTESKQAVLDAIEVGIIATKEEYPLQWVLSGSETGVGTPITYAELLEASALANQNRASIWLKS